MIRDVVDIEEFHVAHALAAQKAPADWRRFVEAVARDVVEHLPDVLPWSAAPSVLKLSRETLASAALSGGLVTGRLEGMLCLKVRECEECLVSLLSIRLPLPSVVDPRVV